MLRRARQSYAAIARYGLNKEATTSANRKALQPQRTWISSSTLPRRPVKKDAPAHSKPASKNAESSKSRPSSADTPARLPRWLRTTLSTLKLGFGFYILLHCLTFFVVMKQTWGPSMIPTLSWDGIWVLISRFFHRRGRNIAVGDLISFENPIRPGYYSIKRVIGMPGDFVCRDTPGKGDGWLVQVPEGHCWVNGDNLAASRDSRHFGPLPLALVRGKVLATFTPFPAWVRSGLVDYEHDEHAHADEEEHTGLVAAVQRQIIRGA